MDLIDYKPQQSIFKIENTASGEFFENKTVKDSSSMANKAINGEPTGFHERPQFNPYVNNEGSVAGKWREGSFCAINSCGRK